MRVHRVSFDGSLLERGFWLYAWLVSCGVESVVYVGRTGDSSSQHAASPYSRLSQHLNHKPGATSNMLYRQVRKHGWAPVSCRYEFVAFGPIFAEQLNLETHREKRDVIAPLETELAQLFRERGFNVVGKHGKRKEPDTELLLQVRRAFAEVLG